jgi:Tol biopolymer transport system component
MLARQDRRTQVGDDTFDWWWVPVDGRAPVKTGVLGLPEVNGARVEPASWTSSGRVVFALRGDVWSVPVSMSDGRVTGSTSRLTAGTGEARTPTVSQDGTVVFASVNPRRVVLRASLDAGKESEPPLELYADDRTVSERASVTADGSMIVFERPAGWAPSSHLLYLLLDTDGFRCLWAQRVDSVSGRLEGIPFAARHFHDEPGMSTSLGNPVTPGGFVYGGTSVTGNLWRLGTTPTP